MDLLLLGAMRAWCIRGALGVALAAALVACGGDSSPEERATERLDEALAAHAEGRIDEAVDGYEKVLEDEPGNQYAHYNLGLVHQQAGRNADAEREYRAAISTDPNFASALFNLAILRTEADPDEAEELYRSVLTLQPDNASAHLNLGFLLIEQGEEEDGQSELDDAVQLDPSLASRIPEQEPEDPELPADDIPATTTP
jgi:Tfp pilus assembly protein PilF